MNILLIDDSLADRVAIKAILQGGRRPWLRSAQIIEATSPPEPAVLVANFDGAIIDNQLVNEVGVEYAQRLHLLDWWFPVMILTGSPEGLPHDALGAVRRVASKDFAKESTRFDPLNMLWNIRAFAREVAEYQVAREARGAAAVKVTGV